MLCAAMPQIQSCVYQRERGRGGERKERGGKRRREERGRGEEEERGRGVRERRTKNGATGARADAAS
ncbi:unnamed protein product [Knipowitschia caucasica]